MFTPKSKNSVRWWISTQNFSPNLVKNWTLKMSKNKFPIKIWLSKHFASASMNHCRFRFLSSLQFSDEYPGFHFVPLLRRYGYWKIKAAKIDFFACSVDKAKVGLGSKLRLEKWMGIRIGNYYFFGEWILLRKSVIITVKLPNFEYMT